MTITEARAITKEWQDRLGLTHWEIHVRWAKKEDKCDDCFGQCSWYTEEAVAQILLNKKIADEETIVHELTHIAFEGHLPEPTGYDAVYEQSINRFAKLLVKWKKQA